MPRNRSFLFCTSLLMMFFVGVTMPRPAFAATTDPAEEARIRFSNSVTMFSLYRRSHDIADLQRAVDLMDGTIDLQTWTPSNFIGKRRLLVRQWANLVAAVRDVYPLYDPNSLNDSPASCIVPPTNQGLPCGANPKLVTDLNARAEYVAQLQENAEKYKRSLYWSQIDKIHMHVMADLTGSLRFFNRVGAKCVSPDVSALDAIVTEAGIRGDDLEAIEAAINST